MHAAGPRAVVLDGGAAVVTAAGRAVAADAVARAAGGNGAGVVATAAEALAAPPEDLGLAALALAHRGAAVDGARCGNDGTAVGVAKRRTVAAQWLLTRMPLGRHDQHSENGNGRRCPKTCCT